MCGNHDGFDLLNMLNIPKSELVSAIPNYSEHIFASVCQMEQISPPRAQAASEMVVRFREPDAGEDGAEDETKLASARKAWMKEYITISEGIHCDVLAWWKDLAFL